MIVLASNRFQRLDDPVLGPQYRNETEFEYPNGRPSVPGCTPDRIENIGRFPMSISIVHRNSLRAAAVPLLLWVLATFAMPAVVDAQGDVYANFGTAVTSVVEDDIVLQVPVVLSEEPADAVGVIVWAVPVSADGDDFAHGWVLVPFDIGGPQIGYAEIPIYDDVEFEGIETFEMYIADGEPGYIPGSNSHITVTIFDDDSDVGLAAHFETEDSIPLDLFGRLALLAEPDEVFSIDVVMDVLPPGGGPVHIVSSTPPYYHTVQFTDSPRETFTIDTVDVPEDQEYAVLYLQIPFSDLRHKSRSEQAVVVGYRSSPNVCMSCFVNFIYWVLKGVCTESLLCGNECPDDEAAAPTGSPIPSPPKIDSDADLETLTRYRDEVLQGTEVGDFLIQVYEEQSQAAVDAILQDYTLIYRLVETWGLWLPAIAAIVDGEGENFTVTAEMQDSLLGVLAEFEQLGTPELGRWVDKFRTELELETIAGETAAEMQDAMENDVHGVKNMSWGEVKSLYR